MPKSKVFVSFFLLLVACLAQNCLRAEDSNGPKYVGAIICMDGKVQNAIENYMKKQYHAKRVDRITDAGPCKVLADNKDGINRLKHMAKDISEDHHKSPVIAITGHSHCAGNPVSKAEQIEQMRKATKVVQSWGVKAEIILLWIEGEDEDATVEQVK